MNTAVAAKLEVLRSDFQSNVGKPFTHFYCPILFQDEETDLCEGHVVSQAFEYADRSWTIQRADVDTFFGAFFESDFVAIQERGKHHLFDVLRSARLSRLLRPRITMDGREIQYYRPVGPVPPEHSDMILSADNRPTTRLALKLRPSDILDSQQANWEIGFTKDIRLAALVSLLRSAHLTLFELLGYRYALSASGYFMGSDVLGKFFLRNVGKRRRQVLASAEGHFLHFVNLVRPVLKCPPTLTGTSADRIMYLCSGKPKAWGIVVFVRAGPDMHAVVVPVLEDAEGAARFAAFLKEPAPRFEVQLMKFNGHQWDVARDSTTFAWPAANFT